MLGAAVKQKETGVINCAITRVRRTSDFQLLVPANDSSLLISSKTDSAAYEDDRWNCFKISPIRVRAMPRRTCLDELALVSLLGPASGFVSVSAVYGSGHSGSNWTAWLASLSAEDEYAEDCALFTYCNLEAFGTSQTVEEYPLPDLSQKVQCPGYATALCP
jgi:predicted lipase